MFSETVKLFEETSKLFEYKDQNILQQASSPHDPGAEC